jgi:DNA-directed RNA polymerase specialized sigma24 family protein
MKKRRMRRDVIPTPAEFAVIRCGIQRSAARFNQRLSRESIEDLTQEVLLRLWKSGTEGKLRDRPAYVGRVMRSAIVDMVRIETAKKRKLGAAKFDPGAYLYRPAPTPEEILLAREEALGVLKRSPTLRRRVRSTVRHLKGSEWQDCHFGSLKSASGLVRV